VVVCVATDGREDFEKRMVLREEELEARAVESRVHLLRRGKKGGKLDLLNRLSIGWLEGALCEDLLSE
jgi:hypothetical protein